MKKVLFIGKYKIGDKFRWKKGRCFNEYYLNDIYELAKRKNGDYYVKTVYSWYGDYDDWNDNRYGDSYEEICKDIDRDLEKIED